MSTSKHKRSKAPTAQVPPANPSPVERANRRLLPGPAVGSKTVSIAVVNRALDDLRHRLFEAMGIVRMASHTAMESGYAQAETDIWTSLDVAHDILCRIVDRTQSTDKLLADEEEVPRGEY